MPWYRRNRVAGGVYFFTVVTLDRGPFLTTDLARRCLRESWEEEQIARPFEATAVVLLPDHLHTIWTLPPGDDDDSTRWNQIKKGFTERFLEAGGDEGRVSTSRYRKRERGIWQRRFWEHTSHDEDDIKRCIDYVHYNPVKHRVVTRVRDYPYSSFHRYVTLGEYDLAWGEGEIADIPGCEWDK